MSRGLVERANSDLGHIAYSSTSTATATGDDLHHRQCSNNKQRLALLFSSAGAGAWRRSEATTATSTRAETSCGGRSKKKHVQGSSIGPRVKKYMAMAEQLFASFSSGGSAGGGRGDDDDRRRRGPINSNSFPSSSGSGRWPSKRHGGYGIRLFSEPASLRGSPANSGRLSARGIIPKAPSSEEDLQSAIQAAIAHCKNSSVAAAKQQPQAAGGDRPRQA